MELDIYIPSIRLGIEFDGANWHNSAAQFKREKKKYDICKAHQITLIRVKEDVESHREDVADAVYYIPKVRTYTKLEETINAIAVVPFCQRIMFQPNGMFSLDYIKIRGIFF